MKVTSAAILSNVYNYTKAQSSTKSSQEVSKIVNKTGNGHRINIFCRTAKKPIVMELQSPTEYIPLKIEKIPDEFQNLNITSIFDVEDVPQEVKDFLKDKNVTTVRYQRLYEDDPKKATVFIESIMAGHFNSGVFLDEQYAGQDYDEILSHISDLLIEEYTYKSGDYKDHITGNGTVSRFRRYIYFCFQR